MKCESSKVKKSRKSHKEIKYSTSLRLKNSQSQELVSDKPLNYNNETFTIQCSLQY